MRAPEPDAEVVVLREFLESMLEEAEQVDAIIHRRIHKIRERIFALKLAEDPTFVSEHEAFSQRLEKDPPSGEGLTAEQFAERYLASR